MATNDGDLPQFLLHYDVLPFGYGVERRWLDVHPEPSLTPTTPKSSEEALSIAKQMLGELASRREHFFRPSD